MTLGEKLKMLRERQELSLTDASEMIGISYAHLSRLENDACRLLSKLKTKIAKVYDVDESQLVFSNIIETAADRIHAEKIVLGNRVKDIRISLNQNRYEFSKFLGIQPTDIRKGKFKKLLARLILFNKNILIFDNYESEYYAISRGLNNNSECVKSQNLYDKEQKTSKIHKNNTRNNKNSGDIFNHYTINVRNRLYKAIVDTIKK